MLSYSKLPFKILLTGAFSVGKTQLAQFIEQQQIKNVTVLHQTRWEVIAGGDAPDTPEFFDVLFEKQLKKEAGTHSGKSPTKIQVLDQSVIDLIAYAQLLEIPIKKAWEEHCTYDFVFVLDKDDIYFELQKFPRVIPPTQNWLQDREKLHNLLLKEIMRLGIPFAILSGTLEERFAVVQKLINQKLEFIKRRRRPYK